MKKQTPTERLTQAEQDDFRNKTLTWFALTCRLQGNFNLKGTMFCRMTEKHVASGEVAPGIPVREAIAYLEKVKYICKAKSTDAYLRWNVTTTGAARAHLAEV